MNDDLQTASERFFVLLHWQLSQRLPKPDGIHVYSTGNLINNFKTNYGADYYELVISEGVDYARYAMGYDDNDNKRNPKGMLESINFRTIDDCIETVSRVVGELER